MAQAAVARSRCCTTLHLAHLLLQDGEGGAEPSLSIDLEDLATGASWHGEFTATYVESITSKTGNFKRFGGARVAGAVMAVPPARLPACRCCGAVLVKMLITAMRQQTETVFLDLLTYTDLVSQVGRE